MVQMAHLFATAVIAAIVKALPPASSLELQVVPLHSLTRRSFAEALMFGSTGRSSSHWDLKGRLEC